MGSLAGSGRPPARKARVFVAATKMFGAKADCLLPTDCARRWVPCYWRKWGARGFRDSHGACPQADGGAAGRSGLLRRTAAAVGAKPMRFQAVAAGLVRGLWDFLARACSDHRDLLQNRGWEAKCNCTLIETRYHCSSCHYPAGSEAGALLKDRICLGRAMTSLSLQGTNQVPISRSRNQGRGGPNSR